jgi:hypothetical protein
MYKYTYAFIQTNDQGYGGYLWSAWLHRHEGDINLHTDICLCIYMNRTYLCVYACMHIYTDVYIYTYIHIYIYVGDTALYIAIK